MPKKATSQNEDKKVSEAAFLKAFDAKKAAAKAATKEKRPSGLLDDVGIMKKLGLDVGDRQTFNANVSKIVMSFAKNDPSRPMFRFVYIIVSDDKRANGTIISRNFIIEEGVRKDGTVWKSEEEALNELFFEFQGIGDDTEKWANDPIKKCVEAAKHHTKENTPVTLTIAHSTAKDDSSKHYMNVRVNPALADDNSDLDQSDEEESSDDEFNAEDWLGGWVEFDNNEYGHIRMKVEEYDADSHTFTGTDDSGEKWEGDYAPSADVVDWSENQDG